MDAAEPASAIAITEMQDAPVALNAKQDLSAARLQHRTMENLPARLRAGHKPAKPKRCLSATAEPQHPFAVPNAQAPLDNVPIGNVELTRRSAQAAVFAVMDSIATHLGIARSRLLMSSRFRCQCRVVCKRLPLLQQTLAQYPEPYRFQPKEKHTTAFLCLFRPA